MSALHNRCPRCGGLMGNPGDPILCQACEDRLTPLAPAAERAAERARVLALQALRANIRETWGLP